MDSRTQVLVIGGGPAGSTAAALLARQAFDVTLLERDGFPRYHIGESLLPSSLPILDLMGARDKVENHGFQRKGGGHYDWGGEAWNLPFSDLRGNATYSWQFIRSEFDHLLLQHAQQRGGHGPRRDFRADHRLGTGSLGQRLLVRTRGHPR